MPLSPQPFSSAPPTYRIRHWAQRFESAESRKLRQVRWVPMANSHDDARYRRVAAMPNGLELFGAWMALVQVASKMPVRGTLRDAEGPLDASDLAACTGFPVEAFQRALETFTQPKIAWLELVEEEADAASPEDAAGTPADAGSISCPPPELHARRVGEGREGVTTTTPDDDSCAAASPGAAAAAASVAPGLVYPTLEQALAYASGQGERVILPACVEKWWLDRERRGWRLTIGAGHSMPIPHWQKDLQYYARAWQENEDEKAARSPGRKRPRHREASVLPSPPGTAGTATATAAAPAGEGLPAPLPPLGDGGCDLLQQDLAEARRFRELDREWQSAPHPDDELPPSQRRHEFPAGSG